MGRTRFISDNFWSDPDFSDLTAENRLGLLLFLTSKESNIIGVYRVSWRILGAGPGWTHEQMLQVARDLEGKGFIEIDEKNNWVWVKSWWKNNSLRAAFMGNVAKPALRELSQVPNAWKQKIYDWLKNNDVDGACKALPSPLQGAEPTTNTTSIDIGIDTTTTDDILTARKISSCESHLVFPKITSEEKGVILKLIQTTIADQKRKQELLDELAGAILKNTISKGNVPFFRSLIKAYKENQFFPNLGVTILSYRNSKAAQEVAKETTKDEYKIDPCAFAKGEQMLLKIMKKKSLRSEENNEPI